MTPTELDAIRARDRDYDDIFDEQARMPKDIAHRLVAWPVADRRALLKLVDELRTALAAEMDDTKNACGQLNAEIGRLRSRLAEAEALLRTAVANCDLTGYEGAAAWADRRDAFLAGEKP